MEINYANLVDDMARGGGEHLASLSDLLGIAREEQPAFFSLVQRESPPSTVRDPVHLLEWLQALHRDMTQRRMLAASATGQ
jgi:hypothetical protein